MPYNFDNWEYVLTLSDLFASFEQSKRLTTDKLFIRLKYMKLLIFDHF